MDIIEEIKQSAKEKNKRLVLPEGNDERIIKAADIISREGLANVTVIGDPEEVQSTVQREGIKNFEQVHVVDPSNPAKKEEYTELVYDLRKHKGVTKDQVASLIEDPLYLACAMLKNSDADGAVAGAAHATRDVLKSAFQIIKTKPNISIVSGAFMMVMKEPDFGHNGIIFFADSGVNVNPNQEELAEIAISTARSAKAIGGFEPVVALLSFSTKGSAEDEMSQKVRKATEMAQEKAPHLKIDGEFQADTALSPDIAKKKAPDSQVAGKANVLIFPNLDAGNIGYKLVQYFGGVRALGPLLQGMASPVNDLSRGCSVEDIVNISAITMNQE